MMHPAEPPSRPRPEPVDGRERAADAAYMLRAIELAKARLGRTWPNPSVGCVLVARQAQYEDGAVIAEAATAEGGRPHAEEQALAQAGEAARGATAYVTLEPCGARSAGGLACAVLLAEAGVAHVVVACDDPTPYASGQGYERLAEAGVPVERGLLEAEARPLIEGFLKRLRTGRPLVHAATSGDGYDAPLEPLEGEDLDAALVRHGGLGHTRLWVPEHGGLAAELSGRGLLDATSAAAEGNR